MQQLKMDERSFNQDTENTLQQTEVIGDLPQNISLAYPSVRNFVLMTFIDLERDRALEMAQMHLPSQG
jgi:hypothetical protein